jgi:hypothetical protein
MVIAMAIFIRVWRGAEQSRTEDQDYVDEKDDQMH